MPKFRSITTRVVLSLLVVYNVWLLTPITDHQSDLESIRATAAERFHERNSQAGNPQLNGYLDPTFVSYWAPFKFRKNYDQPVANVHYTVDHWVEYSKAGPNVPIEHLQILSGKTYYQAREAFKELLPTLLIAIDKPIFVIPDNKAELEHHYYPDYIRLGTLFEAVTGVARDYSLEGQTVQAADLSSALVKWGGALQTYEALTPETYASYLQIKGAEAFLSTVHPQQDLRPGQWQELSGVLTSSVPPTDQLRMTLEFTFLTFHNTLTSESRMIDFLDNDEFRIPLWSKVPGHIDREIKIFTNRMFEHYQRLLDKKDTPRLKAIPNRTLNKVLGKRSYLADKIYSDDRLMCFEDQTDETRAVVTGLALTCGVKAYQEQMGRLPLTLNDIRALRIPIPTDQIVEATRISYTLDGQHATLRIPLDDQGHRFNKELPSFNDSNYWVQFKNFEMTLSL